MEQETVVWYKSARIWSAIITVISLGLSLSGLAPMITPDQISTYVNIILMAIAAIGAGSTVTGQVVATKKIVLTSTNDSVTVSVANTDTTTT